MLHSTPTTNRHLNFSRASSIDCSTITTASENVENKRRAIEDRNYIPHCFDTSLLNKSGHQNNDGNKYGDDNDPRSIFKAPNIPSRSGFSSSLNRSNTFAIRKDPNNIENNQRFYEEPTRTPHFFGDALLNKSQTQNNDIFGNKLSDDKDARPNLKAPIIPSRLGYSSCNRSNTFVIRKDPINKETTRFSPYSRPEKPKGPPLRSLNDSLPIIKRRNEDIPQVKEPVAEDEKDFWVTVFGFDKEKGVQPILELFGRHGQIVKTALPNNDSNYIHIRYTTKAHVDQALQRNGHMNDNYFIGVIQSPYVSYGSMSNEYTIETPAVNGNAASVEKTVAPISTSSPSNSPRYINGIRSLAAPVRNPPSVQQSKASSLINFLFKGKSSE